MTNAALPRYYATNMKNTLDMGTNAVIGVVIEVTDELMGEIEKAYQIVRDNPFIDEVRVRFNAAFLGGEDEPGVEGCGLSGEDLDRSLEVYEKLREDIVESDDLSDVMETEKDVYESARRHESVRISNSVLVINEHIEPYIAAREKYGEEVFETSILACLSPPSQAARWAAQRQPAEAGSQAEQA